MAAAGRRDRSQCRFPRPRRTRTGVSRKPSIADASYWNSYILPRRELAVFLLKRAQTAGTVVADSDLDALIDMMAGAVMYRVLQPDPPDATEMLRYLRAVYRHVGLIDP